MAAVICPDFPGRTLTAVFASAQFHPVFGWGTVVAGVHEQRINNAKPDYLGTGVASQTFTSPGSPRSPLPEAICQPSGLTAMLVTGSLCPRRVSTS